MRYGALTIAGFYVPPTLDLEQSQGGLQRFAATVGFNSHRPVIALGDFNVRCVAWGDRVNNPQGIAIRACIRDIGMERIPPSAGSATFRNGRGQSIVDHVFASEAAAAIMENVVIFDREALGGSDHRPVLATLSWDRHPINIEDQSPRGWNRWRLKKDDVVKCFQDRLALTYDALWSELSYAIQLGNAAPDMRQNMTNKSEDAFIRWLEDGLKKHVGRTTRKKKDEIEFETP